MYKVEDFPFTLTTPIPIGRQGETGARQIQFDISELVSGYSEYTIVLAEQRSQDATAFNINSTLSGTTLTWNVDAYDTYYDGHGRIEIRLIKNGIIVKSAVAYTICEKSLTGNEGAPAPSPSWYDELIDKVDTNTQDISDIKVSLDDKLGITDYSAAAAVGTADNLIDRKATATEQEWLGLRTSCGDVSISDDGTARIDAIYGNTVDGVNMTVDAIETVGFNLFNKADYEGETVTYDGRTCIEYAGSAAWTKLVSDGAYLGLVQIEVGAYIYRRGYAPNAVFEYSDGTTEVVLPRNGNGTPDSWGQFYFLSNPEKNVTAVKFKNYNTTSTTNRSYADLDSICIHYVWSGYRNGEFEEYWKRVLELPISTYFPNGMMSTETVRDELRADKAIQRCELSGGVVVALAEPVETPIDPPLNLVYKVSDFGTENAKSSGTSAPFIADIAYNSDFTRMIVNNSDHIGTLSGLQTTAKNNLVAAINEVAQGTGVTDVKVDGESVVSDGIANIDLTDIEGAVEANATAITALDATLVGLSARMDTAEESIELFVNTGITMQNGRLCVRVERS